MPMTTAAIPAVEPSCRAGAASGTSVGAALPEDEEEESSEPEPESESESESESEPDESLEPVAVEDAPPDAVFVGVVISAE